MYCRNCGEYVSEDMLFCPRCGFQLQVPKRICYYCKNPLKDGEMICPCCGKNQQVQMHKEDDPYRGYWKKPILWIILVALFVGAIFISEYITSHPITITQTETQTHEDIKISGKMSDMNIYANNQCEGYALIDDSSLYCVKNHHLYVSSLAKVHEMSQLIDDCQGYLSMYDGKIYYCDTSNDYYSYEIETKKQEKILENIYYPVVVEGKLYYQLDEDNESIHCLDLNTKEDKKYNDSVSYDITVDTAQEKIYYLNYQDDEYCLKRIDFNGENDEKIYDCHQGISFVLDKDNIYVSDNQHVVKINKKSKKAKVIKDDIQVNYINICQDQLVMQVQNNLYTMSKDGKEEKKLYDGLVSQPQVVGHQIIFITYNENYSKTLKMIDMDGNSMDLFLNEIEEFENLEEV